MSGPSGNQLVSFSRESWCFLRRSRGKHHDSREKKTNWFPEGPDIKYFVVFLVFHFNSNKRITWANQNSRLGTYNNTNLILKPLNEWFTILKALASFSSTSCSFSPWVTFKSRCFLAWASVFVLLCSFTKEKTGSVFPAFCHATFHPALITCCDVSLARLAGYIA